MYKIQISLQHFIDMKISHAPLSWLSVCVFVLFVSFVSWISSSHVNNFTGTVYQSVLLSQKQCIRTVSMDESVQPNTSPAQWPGKLAKLETFLPALKETDVFCFSLERGKKTFKKHFRNCLKIVLLMVSYASLQVLPLWFACRVQQVMRTSQV